ncbi:MAG: GNAT family N-acetyltransferase [Lachnospiraceae bacterium]|nr:GNAT family N-acetyltransferase [Lachnospiraceae bacterium]
MEKTMNKILETPRLFLREMTADDFDALYCVLADPGIMQHYPYAFDEERVRDWISRNIARYQRNGFGLWAVCLKDTGEMIGDCGALPDWKKDPVLTERLADSIRKAEADICVEGHWVPVSKEETIRDLSEGV